LIEHYYELKSGMLEAADKEEAKHFKTLYGYMLALVGPLSKAVQGITDEAIAKISVEILNAGRVHPELMGGQLAEHKPGEFGHIFDSQRLRKELEGVGRKEFDSTTSQRIAKIVNEVVTELYDDASKRDHMRQKLLADIRTTHWTNQFPDTILEGDFSAKRPYILGALVNMTKGINAFGTTNLTLRRIVLGHTDSELVLRSTLKHELIHHLAVLGEIKIPPEWEKITWAIDLIERIKHAKGTWEEGEQCLSEYESEFGPGCKLCSTKERRWVPRGMWVS